MKQITQIFFEGENPPLSSFIMELIIMIIYYCRLLLH